MVIRFILLISCVFASPLLSAQEAAPAATKESENLPPRRGAFVFSSDVRKLDVQVDDSRYNIDSFAPDVSGGYAWIQDRYYIMGRAHLALGPTSQKFPDSPPLDFSGYGFSLLAGTSLNGKLRKSGGDYGVELGLESFELVGRSFRSQVLSDGSTTDAWVLKIRWIGVSGGIFATFLKPSRPAGSRPEWLVTRMEGFRVGLGLVAPLKNSWDLRFERNGAGEGDRGEWKGLLGLLSVSILLGV